MQLRPSSLPVFMKCSASITLPSVEEPKSEAMLAGTERHRKLAEMPEKALSVHLSVCPSETGLASVRTEEPIHLPEMDGTVDAIVQSDSYSVIIDWKGMFDDQDPTDQVQAYMQASGISAAYIARVDDDLNVQLPARLILYDNTWYPRFKARLAEPPQFTIGDHCQRCSSFRCCPAQLGLVGGLSKVESTGLTHANAAEAWVKLKQYKAVLEVVEESLRSMALIAPIELPNGHVLKAVETSRETIVAEKALLLMPELSGHMKLSLAKEMVTQQQLVQLRLAGATKTTITTAVREVKND
jgi:hypothetical protein